MVKLYSALAGYNLHTNLTNAKEYKDSAVDTWDSSQGNDAVRNFCLGNSVSRVGLIFLCFGFIFAILGSSESDMVCNLPGLVLTTVASGPNQKSLA